MRTMIMTMLVCALTMTMSAQQATYRYETGKEYKYLIEQTALRIQEVQGQTINVNSESTITTVVKPIEELEDGSMRMQMTVESALLIVEDPQQTKTLGGDAAGKSATYVIDRQGDVVDVDTTVRELDDESQAVIMGAIDILPSFDAAKLGDDKWTVEEVDTSGQGDSKIIRETETHYTVKGTKEINGHKCYEIAVESETDSDGKIVRGDQEMMVSGTQEGKGTIYYNAEKGLLVKLEVEVNGDQTIMLTGNNMRIPITSNQVIKVELVSE